jgi:hypothetical protein
MQEPNTTEEAEAFIPTAVASNDPSLHEYPTEAEAFIPDVVASNEPSLNPNPTFTVPRKAAKRSERWYQPFFTPARKKPRIKEESPLPPRRSSRRVNAISRTGTFTAAAPPPPNASVVAASTFRRSPRQAKLPQTETSEAQLDGNEDADLSDLDRSLIAAWEERFSELADHRNIHGHCNVPWRCSENFKLAKWVARQRYQYRLHKEGKTSYMMLSRIQKLESLGFEWEWDSLGALWEDRLSELADYLKIHGHCNVPKRYSENVQLGSWVRTQRQEYRLRLKGKRSQMTLSRIQALESLGLEWDCPGAAWEDHLSELAEFSKIHDHCNVKYSENIKLARWVTKQRYHYGLHLEGKASHMTLSRIEKLEGLGFKWNSRGEAWEGRLSELARYRKKHGHCNVSKNSSENAQLGEWVATQRYQYRLHLKGETSLITLPRIQALESVGFEWKPGRWPIETRETKPR